MKSITPAQKLLAVALASLIISCLGYWFMERTINHTTASFVEARDARARVLYEEENKDRTQQLLDSTADIRTTLESRLLSVDEPLEFLALIDDTIPGIADAPTRVVSISKEEDDKKKNEETESHVRAVLNVEGDWDNLFHLLLLIEHLPYAVSLDRAVLTLTTTESEYGWGADLFLSGGVKE